MTELIEQTFSCPYCWSSTSVEVDLSVDGQNFIEDCQVCCQPIEIHYKVVDNAVSEFEVLRSQ